MLTWIQHGLYAALPIMGSSMLDALTSHLLLAAGKCGHKAPSLLIQASCSRSTCIEKRLCAASAMAAAIGVSGGPVVGVLGWMIKIGVPELLAYYVVKPHHQVADSKEPHFPRSGPDPNDESSLSSTCMTCDEANLWSRYQWAKPMPASEEDIRAQALHALCLHEGACAGIHLLYPAPPLWLHVVLHAHMQHQLAAIHQ